MRFIELAIVMIAVGFAGSTSADEPQFSPAVREVIAAVKAKSEAFNRRDDATWRRYAAEDRLFVSDDGVIMVLPQSPAEMKLPPAYDQGSNYRDFQAREVGDVVIIDFLYDEHEHYGAADLASSYAASQVWTRQSGQWVMVAGSVTPTKVNHHAAIAVDPKKLADYAGRYEWRPGLVDEMTVEGDHLMSSFGAEGPKRTFFTAPDVNAESDDLGEVVFQRNAAGRVTGYVYHFADGQTVPARKLP